MSRGRRACIGTPWIRSSGGLAARARAQFASKASAQLRRRLFKSAAGCRALEQTSSRRNSQGFAAHGAAHLARLRTVALVTRRLLITLRYTLNLKSIA